jgi:hypothetical protein
MNDQDTDKYTVILVAAVTPRPCDRAATDPVMRLNFLSEAHAPFCAWEAATLRFLICAAALTATQ